MPVDLTPEEMAAFRRGEAPTPMLDLIGLMTCHAIGAARTLGVFDALAAGPLTADELAATVSADPAALEQLLGVLHTTGYVTRQENEQTGGHDDEQAGEQSPRPGTRPGSGAQLGVRYANTPAAAAWLCSDSPTDYGRILGLWQAIVEERWTGLADAVRSGKPAGGFYDWLAGRPDLSEAFHALQRGMAEWLADEVVPLVPLPEGSHSLLDLGGGDGVYAREFCRATPGLRATIIDAATAERTEGPLTWRAADLLTCDLPGGQDVTMILNVLHGFAAADAEALVARAAGTLRPGGLLVVMESLPQHGGTTADLAFGAGFSLNLWHTQGGALHPPEMITGWLRSAGCAPAPWQQLSRSPSHAVVTATAQ